MSRAKCIRCGNYIAKSGLNDPYLCRDCESDSIIPETNRYAYLDE